jgi:hypothetical protein
MSFIRFLALLPLLAATGFAASIFVSHYQGTVSTLNFEDWGNGTYTLTPNTTLSIGGQPSWLTWDSTSRTIYVPDETAIFAPGSLTAIKATTNGALSELARTSAPGGAVANVLYGNNSYVATAL